MIESDAAVLHGPGEPLTIETVQVEPPRSGEALVEIAASGLCHTDTTTFDGKSASCVYPAILGHEGAGRIVEVGPDVSDLRNGDHVIPLYSPECRKCKMCLSGRTTICRSIKATRDQGVMPDGTSRFKIDGETVHHFMGTSTFSRYTVVPEIALAKIDPQIPFDIACLFGCGVTTGVGAAIKHVNPEDNVVVFGLGGIGVNVVQGARLAGAGKIIGVDPNEAKKAMAQRVGMTDFINAKIGEQEVVEAVKDVTGGGGDIVFECTGLVDVMSQSLECCHVGWGTSVIIGVEPTGSQVAIAPVLLRYGRSMKGSYFGDIRSRSELGRLINMYKDGRLEVESLITHRLSLSEINRGFDMMASGESLRSVVLLE